MLVSNCAKLSMISLEISYKLVMHVPYLYTYKFNKWSPYGGYPLKGIR